MLHDENKKYEGGCKKCIMRCERVLEHKTHTFHHHPFLVWKSMSVGFHGGFRAFAFETMYNGKLY